MGETASRTAVSGGANFFTRKFKSLLWLRGIVYFNSLSLPLPFRTIYNNSISCMKQNVRREEERENLLGGTKEIGGASRGTREKTHLHMDDDVGIGVSASFGVLTGFWVKPNLVWIDGLVPSKLLIMSTIHTVHSLTKVELLLRATQFELYSICS